MREEQVQMAKAMAWERAKGELMAMLQACGHRRLTERARLDDCSKQFNLTKNAIERFILKMESQGYVE